MISEKEKKNREELIRLIQENPDLPVLPMVDSDVAYDDCACYWAGSWGDVHIDEYVVSNNKCCEGRIIFKNDNDIFDTLLDYLGYEEFESLPDDDDECRKIYESLPWTKAIIVYIYTLE